MKKNKIITALAFSLLGTTSVFAQSTGNIGTGEFKSTAKIENTCIISADNVNFGQVYAPLTTQGSQSQMRVLCSKDASYTIDLNYASTGSANPTAPSSPSSTEGFVFEGDTYTLKKTTGQIGLLKNGVEIRPGSYHFVCYTDSRIYVSRNGTGGDTAGKIFTAMGYNLTVSGNPVDSQGICTGTSVSTKFINKFYNLAVNYGVMNGSMRGDKLAYKITLPGDLNKVWNNGINSYVAKGTGVEQNIDINAQIVPDQSSSRYIAQDMYTDTITAVISY